MSLAEPLSENPCVSEGICQRQLRGRGWLLAVAEPRICAGTPKCRAAAAPALTEAPRRVSSSLCFPSGLSPCPGCPSTLKWLSRSWSRPALVQSRMESSPWRRAAPEKGDNPALPCHLTGRCTHICWRLHCTHLVGGYIASLPFYICFISNLPLS